jgi:TonB family protein
MRMFRLIALSGLSMFVLAVGANAEIHVSPDDAMKAVVQKAAPEYPPMAKQMHISGRVEIAITIEPDGSVSEAKVQSGNALLTPAALGAIKKWKFTPFTENGTPTRAVTSIGFDFKL